MRGGKYMCLVGFRNWGLPRDSVIYGVRLRSRRVRGLDCGPGELTAVGGKRRAAVSWHKTVTWTVLSVDMLTVKPPSLPGDAARGLPAASPLAKTGVGMGVSSQPPPPPIGYPPQSSSPYDHQRGAFGVFRCGIMTDLESGTPHPTRAVSPLPRPHAGLKRHLGRPVCAGPAWWGGGEEGRGKPGRWYRLFTPCLGSSFLGLWTRPRLG